MSVPSQKVLLLSILVLVVLNLGTLYTLWVSRTSRFSRPMTETPLGLQQDRGVGRMLPRRLDFTPEQVNRFNQLRSEHFERTKAIHRDIGHRKQQIFEILVSGSNDTTHVGIEARALGEAHRQLELANFEHFSQIRNICTERQKIEFERLMGDLSDRMIRGPGSHAGGHRRGPTSQ